MPSVSELVKGAKVDELHRVTETEGAKFMCFTRLEGDWIICVTDGISLWRIQVDNDELDAFRDVAGVSTIEAYLSRFRKFSSQMLKNDFYEDLLIGIKRISQMELFSRDSNSKQGWPLDHMVRGGSGIITYVTREQFGYQDDVSGEVKVTIFMVVWSLVFPYVGNAKIMRCTPIDGSMGSLFLHTERKNRNGFLAGEVNVAVIGNKVTLTVGKATSALTFDLFEAKAADKKVEMQNVLFRLAESATSLEAKLSKANEAIETLKAQKGANSGSGGSVFMDLGPKKGPNQTKLKPKKAGMSAINPTSKKRKAAQGVVFD